jgi:hypothetical protein
MFACYVARIGQLKVPVYIMYVGCLVTVPTMKMKVKSRYDWRSVCLRVEPYDKFPVFAFIVWVCVLSTGPAVSVWSYVTE